ncbi:MAG: LacI family DNA-binding transcriptional regulator [Victivallaceae bacterium]|nr:LacI family DNA-binding transcriptional regulator [Victivallaceae bacterium]
MNAKIKDICRVTGLSVGTVCEALNGKPRVAEKTRNRVREVAEQLNYRPNNLGRALQSRKSSLLGYFCIDITVSILAGVLHELTFAATLKGYGILFQTPLYSSESEIDRIDFLLSKNVECIITSGCELATWEYLRKIKKQGIPVVGASCYSMFPEIPYVVTDDYLGGEMAANCLLGLKHRRMAFFSFNRPPNYREPSFKETLRKKGISSCVSCYSVEQLAALCAAPPAERISAIFAYCDDDALIAKRTVEKSGLRVPDDVSLIGFDDSMNSRLEEINLSTFAHATETIGKETINSALKEINHEAAESVLVPPFLKLRKTTASCRNPE